MRFKPVPDPPTDLEAVAPILEAVPETAGAVDDCCGHLVAKTRLESRGAAETWLVFLRALGLVTEESSGYRRMTERSPPAVSLESADPRLREAFRERVYGADAVIEALERSDEPLALEDVVDAVRSEHRATAPTERVRQLLEWAVLLALADRTDGGRYESTTPSDGTDANM